VSSKLVAIQGKRLPERAVRLIWHEAGGRCMFDGCGMDLGRTPLSTSLSQIAYLAHIVAADEDGPRGSAGESLRISDDPDNILLMCDAHHRLIDRIDANGFTVDRLREMRARHVEHVRRQMESLAYPSAEREATLTEAGWRVQIQRKGSATKPISQTQKQRNRCIATPRARVEHVFGAMCHMGGKLVRCMGIVRTTFALTLETASYNLHRLVYLKERGLPAF
jgi:hypothetical protein